MEKKNWFLQNIVPGIVFLIIGSVFYFLTDIQIKTDETGAFTARTFPYLILGIIILCSILLIVQGVIGIIKEKSREEKDVEGNNEPEREKNYVLLLAAIAVLIIAVLIGNAIGLLASGIIIGAGFLALYGDRKVIHYGIVIGIVIVSYILFKYVFGLNLP